MTHDRVSEDEDLLVPIELSSEEREELNKLFPPVVREDITAGGITLETAHSRFYKAIDDLVNGDGIRARMSSHGDRPSIELFYRHSF